MIRSLLFILLQTFVINTAIHSQDISVAETDVLVEKVMKTFDVPGIAVGIIKDGQLIFAKGYGVRKLGSPEKVDENTLYGIASNSKAFTAAALGMLMDEGKLTWDSKVREFIPEFKLYDPYVSEAFTIRDLLTHRSGLGLGAGDLMMWPDSSDFTKKDIIHNLRYLKPVSEFRTKYDYDNNLYIVAGEVIERVSGMTWEDFIEQKIMAPLNMTKSAASISRLKDPSNIISPHAPVNGNLEVIGIDWSETANAAGGIYSNITDLSKWVILQMNQGKYGSELQHQLFSTTAHEEMWSPQTIIPVRGRSSYNTQFAAYGLGWSLSDVKGYKQVSHTGGLAGIVTQTTIIPDLKLGIIVLTNQQAGAAFHAISNTIKDKYLGVTGMDRVQEMAERVKINQADAHKITSEIWNKIQEKQNTKKGNEDSQMYIGTYTDPWFGQIKIHFQNGKMRFNSIRSPRLRGEMFYYTGHTFVVKWDDRSLDADAFLHFSLDMEGRPDGAKMKAISPLTDFSFDFHDLDFKRVE